MCLIHKYQFILTQRMNIFLTENTCMPNQWQRATENNLACLEKGGQRTERLLFVCYTPDVTGFFIFSLFLSCP